MVVKSPSEGEAVKGDGDSSPPLHFLSTLRKWMADGGGGGGPRHGDFGALLAEPQQLRSQFSQHRSEAERREREDKHTDAAERRRKAPVTAECT